MACIFRLLAVDGQDTTHCALAIGGWDRDRRDQDLCIVIGEREGEDYASMGMIRCQVRRLGDRWALTGIGGFGDPSFTPPGGGSAGRTLSIHLQGRDGEVVLEVPLRGTPQRSTRLGGRTAVYEVGLAFKTPETWVLVSPAAGAGAERVSWGVVPEPGDTSAGGNVFSFFHNPATPTNRCFLRLNAWAVVDQDLSLVIGEWDQDGHFANMGRVKCRVRRADTHWYLSGWGEAAAPEYDPPEPGAATSERLYLMLPAQEGLHPPILIDLRGEAQRSTRAGADGEAVYEVGFAFKDHADRWRTVSPARARSGGADPARDGRLLFAVSPGEPEPAHERCLVPDLRHALEQLAADRRDLLPPVAQLETELHLLQTIRQLTAPDSGEGYDRWCDDFALELENDGSPADLLRRIDARRSELEAERRQRLDIVEQRAENVRELLEDERFTRDLAHSLHHQGDVNDVANVMGEVARAGYLETTQGRAWAIDRERGLHPGSDVWDSLFTIGTVQTLLDGHLDLYEALYPAWARLNPDTLVAATHRLMDGKVYSDFRFDLSSEAALIQRRQLPISELLEEFPEGVAEWDSVERHLVAMPQRLRDERVIMYSVRPTDALGELRLRRAGAVLGVLACAQTISQLREERDAGRRTRATLGLMRDLADLTTALLVLGANEWAATGGSRTAAAFMDRVDSWVGKFSAIAGAGLSIYDAITNVQEGDTDAGLCHAMVAVGVILMEIPSPYTVIPGVVLAIGGSVGAAYFDDDDFEQWAQRSRFGRNPQRSAGESLSTWRDLIFGLECRTAATLSATSTVATVTLRPGRWNEDWELRLEEVRVFRSLVPIAQALDDGPVRGVYPHGPRFTIEGDGASISVELPIRDRDPLVGTYVYVEGWLELWARGQRVHRQRFRAESRSTGVMA